MKRKNIIYSDEKMFDLLDDEEWWNEAVENGYADEMSDKWHYLYEEMNRYIDDERSNLRIDVGNTIIAIADLGLWDGRRCGYKEIKSGLISDCLYSECETNEWYCDAHDFRATMSHHDGTNYVLYRRRKDGITDYQWDNFLHKLYMGTATREHISKYTSSLLPYVAEVYGWKYRTYEHTNYRKVA